MVKQQCALKDQCCGKCSGVYLLNDGIKVTVGNSGVFLMKSISFVVPLCVSLYLYTTQPNARL